jgi:hypothetical protein
MDGQSPYAGLIEDNAGNLYGTTYYGGGNRSGCDGGSSRTLSSCGTVFELARNGPGFVYKTVWDFKGSLDPGVPGDGANPYGDLALDASTGTVHLYGTTAYGGSHESCAIETNFGSILGCGSVFELVPSQNAMYIYSFAGGATNGQTPQGGLYLDRSGGQLFGTTATGGGGQACAGGAGCGTAFVLTPI